MFAAVLTMANALLFSRKSCSLQAVWDPLLNSFTIIGYSNTLTFPVSCRFLGRGTHHLCSGFICTLLVKCTAAETYIVIT